MLSTINADSERESLLLDFALKARELQQIELQLRTLARNDVNGSAPASPEFLTADPPGRITAGLNVPPSAIYLSIYNFRKELAALIQDISSSGMLDTDPEKLANQLKINSLQLSNRAIWAREKARPPIKAPLLLLVPYYVLCWLLDALFEGRPISRLFFLETVARIPYFAYISCLHAYETLGWWRRSMQQKRVHFAEEVNELNHLYVMESLGGSRAWSVRFIAQHASIAYFFILVFMWLCSPTLAYGFSELIEAHAVDTYTEFAEANKQTLESMPVPQCARDYWEGPDKYDFDEFQSQRVKGSRRPVLRSLYDVFCTIRDDEFEHVQTMRACQDEQTVVQSPNIEAAVLLLAAAAVVSTQLAGLDGSISSTLEGTLSSALESGGGLDNGDVSIRETLGEGAVRDATGAGLKGALAAFLTRTVESLETLLKFLI